jgi:hypothetical protein
MPLLSRWQIIAGVLLLILSALTYFIHYLIFRDIHHIFLYMVGDVAFVFIEVFLVSMIIHSLLNQREKKERLEKLNMVVGIFYTEMGSRLLGYFAAFDPGSEKIRERLLVSNEWTPKSFAAIKKELSDYEFDFSVIPLNLEYLHELFYGNKDFLLRILANPTLHEHESFSDMLWAVSHLIEELHARKNFSELPESDMEHLKGDIVRSYQRLTFEWIEYMMHLKINYPYLFSFAMRTNPFNMDATPVVKG